MPHIFRLMFLVMVALTVFLSMGTLIAHLSGDKESALLAITALVSLFLTGKVHYQVEAHGLHKAREYSRQLFAQHNAKLQRELLKAG